jgi:hypothetical protein
MDAHDQYCIPAEFDYPSPDTPTHLDQANAHNTCIMSCQPRLEVGDASVVVNSDGLLQDKAMNIVLEPDQNPETLDKYSQTV